MVRCPHCDEELPPVDDAFCSFCGEDLDPVPASSDQADVPQLKSHYLERRSRYKPDPVYSEILRRHRRAKRVRALAIIAGVAAGLLVWFACGFCFFGFEWLADAMQTLLGAGTMGLCIGLGVVGFTLYTTIFGSPIAFLPDDLLEVRDSSRSEGKRFRFVLLFISVTLVSMVALGALLAAAALTLQRLETHPIQAVVLFTLTAVASVTSWYAGTRLLSRTHTC